MRLPLPIIKNLFLVAAVAVFTLSSPLAGVSFAADCTPPDNSGNGVHWPTGSDAGTFTYQCDGPYSGQWTNDYYTYNPTTNSRTALYSLNYSYDCNANHWYMDEWDYSAASGGYSNNRVITGAPTGLSTGCAPLASTPVNGSGSGSGATENNGNSTAASTTGPGSTNGSNTTQNANVGLNNSNNLTLQNGVYSQSTTGDAGVFYNTSGGSAASGNATSIANIANLLQSTSNVFGDNTATFVTDINGDVNGDFMFDPAAIVASGPGSSNASNTTHNLTVNQNNNTNAGITNDINVGANSGNAAVGSNTNAGDATSGNATAVANLMNLINSTVSAGQSFVGVVNINGNLNGDILLPQDLVNQLLASSGPGSTNSTASTTNLNATATTNTNEAITNNVTAVANSGSADVIGNTSAGNATTGSADTNVTLLNLTGSQIIGANDILVFVNVLGQWVGMIVNAPAGSTSASLGGGITSSGPNSSNSTNDTTNVNANSTTNNNLGITNNVNAHANSGDASVTGNTAGGNATSGNANTAVNLLNITNSNLNLSNFFGVLFINVLGSWTGSFGVNTSAGNPIVATPSSSSTTQSTGTSTAVAGAAPRVFASFLSTASSTAGGSVAGTTDETANVSAKVLGSKTIAKTADALPTADNSTHASLLFPAIGVSIAALMLVGERVVTIRKKHQA